MNTQVLNLSSDLSDYAKKISDLRIKKHLQRVEMSLRKTKPKNIDKKQLNNRIKTLDNLHDYWQAGEFPINTKIKRRTPVFKDEFGNYCAVGYLLSIDGQDKLVTEIQKSNNYIKVPEITNAKYISAINSLGISQAEAARIQPGYPPGGFGGDEITNIDTLSGKFQIVIIGVFIITQVFAMLFFKEMNLKFTQKFLGYLTLLSFGIMLLIIGLALTNLTKYI